MKKNLAFAVVISMAWRAASACGICGCAASGNYLGVLPQYQKHFIGLRYNYRSFNSTHPSSIIPGMSGRKSTEQFQNMELAGRYVPGKRWQILGSVSYQQMVQTINQNSVTVNGLSDASITTYFSVLPGKSRENKSWKHLLQTGVGIKLPTGKNTWANETEEYNPGFQLGTGSYDKILSAIYTARAKKMGFITDANLILTGKNKFEYQFGNKFSATSRVFYTVKNKLQTWLFYTGIYAEKNAPDYWKNNLQRYTGGHIIMPLGGLELYTKNLAFGINYRIPAAQKLSENYVKSNARLLLSVSWLI